MVDLDRILSDTGHSNLIEPVINIARWYQSLLIARGSFSPLFCSRDSSIDSFAVKAAKASSSCCDAKEQTVCCAPEQKSRASRCTERLRMLQVVATTLDLIWTLRDLDLTRLTGWGR